MEARALPGASGAGHDLEPGRVADWFPVSFYNASLGIDQCWAFTAQGNPDVGPDGWGPRHVFQWGNGRWHARGSSYYFESGPNQVANQAPPVGDVGRLTWGDGQALEAWFLNAYANRNARVLKQVQKWNFTAVTQNYVLNFHVEVENQEQ